MTTILPASSDPQQSAVMEDTWSTQPLLVSAPPTRILYAVSDHTAMESTARPSSYLLVVLLAVFALLNLGDLASTYFGIMHGLNEGNPIMRRLLAHYGFSALIADKLIVIAAVTWGALLLSRLDWRVARIIALVCDTLLLLVVISNVVQFAMLR
jgi:hypothetical protein